MVRHPYIEGLQGPQGDLRRLLPHHQQPHGDPGGRQRSGPPDGALHSDSQYLCNAVQKGWLASWIRHAWIKSDKKPVKNVDLWMRLVPLLKTHKVTFKWLRGHAGHAENERCDELARDCAARKELPEDAGYEEE